MAAEATARGGSLRRRLAREGYLVVPAALTAIALAPVMSALGDGRSRRGCLELPAVRALVRCAAVRRLVRAVLGPRAFAVRGLLIDKRAGADWSLPWHRDTAVAVAERRETPGFTGWSVKDGVAHALAPRAVLADLLALRIHLDGADGRSGALRVLPRSHLVEDDAAIARERILAVGRGDVVLLRPLCLHASARSERLAPRRVLHLEFARRELPGGLRWRDRV